MPKKSVLLVDDDAVFLEAASAILESRFEVRTAANGTEAIAALEHDLPDAIVLDVMMDHIAEGYDVARKIKQDRATRHIPIIMLTGVDELYKYRLAVEDASSFHDYYLEKPVKPEKLLAVLEEATGAGGS
jgi:CheY-like chemotaxis protein